jgi:hypothetical protein
MAPFHELKGITSILIHFRMRTFSQEDLKLIRKHGNEQYEIQ